MKKVLLVIGVLGVLLVGGCSILTVGVMIGSDTPSGGGSPVAGEKSGEAPKPGAGEKKVRVEVSAAKPADLSIYSADFTYERTEEVVGKKTYEFTLPKGEGLDIMLSDPDFAGNTLYAGVYEDGKLVSEDSDPGTVTISY